MQKNARKLRRENFINGIYLAAPSEELSGRGGLCKGTGGERFVSFEQPLILFLHRSIV
jgi:hypothetical protein